jgi:DNA polymerase-3 subunit beta
MLAASIAQQKQSLPILANVLLQVTPECLTIIGSDGEIELTGIIKLAEPIPESDGGAITVAARKLLDICRSFSDKSMIELEVVSAGVSNRTTPLTTSNTMQQLKICSGRSKFLLATLPAQEFPITPEMPISGRFSIEQRILGELLKQTSFAMAQQDVRHYLNGILFELSSKELNIVAADGHRLAISSFLFSSLY